MPPALRGSVTNIQVKMPASTPIPPIRYMPMRQPWLSGNAGQLADQRREEDALARR